MIVFLRANFLFLFLVFPTFFILRRFRFIVSFKIHLNLIKWGENKRTKKHYKFLSFIYKTCLYLAISAIIFSIAEPIIHKNKKSFNERGSSIIFLVDVSPSMACKDIDNLSRFDIAKIIIKNFTSLYEGHSLGLSIFGESAAFILVPTIDIATFLLRLDSIEIGDAGDGTAIGLSLSLASSNIKTSPSYIVLLTDGENNTGAIDPIFIANVLKQKGIYLYVVRLGNDGYAPFEYFDKKKQKTYSGNYYTKAMPQMLKNIASNSGGTYLHISSLKDTKIIFKEINNSLHKNNDYSIQKEKIYLHFYFLAFSLIMIATSYIILRFIIRRLND